MPTLPLHQGWLAAQAMTSTASSEFLLGIFVLHQPFGIAIAAHVDADAGIAVAGEIGMGQRIARGRAVALAVGQMLDDGGNLVGVGIVRQPDAGRQRAAVAHLDADVGIFDELAGKFRDGLHGRTHRFSSCTRVAAACARQPLSVGRDRPAVNSPSVRGRGMRPPRRCAKSCRARASRYGARADSRAPAPAPHARTPCRPRPGCGRDRSRRPTTAGRTAAVMSTVGGRPEKSRSASG